MVEGEGNFGTSSKRVWRDEMVACEGVCLIVRALMVMMIACLIVFINRHKSEFLMRVTFSFRRCYYLQMWFFVPRIRGGQRQ